jgi:hypothetical protein
MSFIRKIFFELSDFFLCGITFISISFDLKQPPAPAFEKEKDIMGD